MKKNMSVPSILIVDDEESLRNSLALAFEMEGYSVSAVGSAFEALEAAKTVEFDVILTDLVMPQIDGIGLMERVRPHLPEALVILMTGQATVESAVKALKGGAYDYILKPFKLEEIFHVVTRGLEQRRLQKENLELNEINRRLKEIDQIKSDLLSAVTHEFRTPLTIIFGWLDLLLGNHFGELSPNQVESLQAVRQSSQRLGRLISNVLTYVEFERGELSLKRQALSLAKLLQEVLQGVEGEIQEKGINLEIAISPDFPLLEGDPEKIHLLLYNLVDNAVKFNERGGRLVIRAQPGPRMAELTVYNSRGDIPQERLSYLLEPFTQADMSMTRTAGGLGIGLAVAKAIVETCHGELRIESGRGSGTAVTIRLPWRLPELLTDDR